MKDNKIYKVLRIVFLTLAIISMVFALMKKVGLAASDSSSSGVTSYPLPFGLTSGYGIPSEAISVLSQLDYDSMLADCKAQRGDDVDTVVIVEFSDSDYFILGFCNSEWLITVDSLTLSSNSTVSWGSGGSQITAGRRYSNGYWTDYWFANYWGTNCAIGSHLTSLPSGGYFLNSDELISYYPIYSTAENIYDSSGNLIYTQNFGGGGFDGPGWSEAFEEWIDDEINPVDTQAPSDSSSTPSWLKKILDGLGTINNTIGSGFTLIKNNIGSTRDKITEIYDFITEVPDPAVIGNNVAGAIYQTELFSSFDSAKTSISGVYNSFSNVSARTSSQVAFSIPFSLPYINFSSNFVIDLAWYENIRAVIEPFLNMVLSVGFLFSLIRSIPGILHGNSGEGDS